MSGEHESQWVRRWEIAQILNEKIDVSSWKGDEHTKGVFFTDSHGYTLNKVLAVRIQHQSDEDCALQEDLFFSFHAISSLDDEGIVTEQYPFRDMKAKPKKHYLLFDKEEIDKEEMARLFEGPFDHGVIRTTPTPIGATLDKITNKRDRDRSAAHLQVTEDTLVIHVSKSQEKYKNIILVDHAIPCEVLSPSKNEKPIAASVNAHTLFYLLEIFYAFPYVTFHFGRDRIMITGDGKQKPNVEVVIARLKTA